MVDLVSYNGKFLGFTEKQVQEGIRLFENDCIVKTLNDGTTFASKAIFAEPENLDKLTEENVAKQIKELKVLENVAFKTLELNDSGEFVSNGEMLKMQNDYNQVVETVNKQHSLIEQLNERCNKYYLEIVDQRENLAASRKLRKKHEKEIKFLNAQLDVVNAENELARKRANQTFINQLVNARERDLKEAEDRLAKLSR